MAAAVGRSAAAAGRIAVDTEPARFEAADMAAAHTAVAVRIAVDTVIAHKAVVGRLEAAVDYKPAAAAHTGIAVNNTGGHKPSGRAVQLQRARSHTRTRSRALSRLFLFPRKNPRWRQQNTAPRTRQ